MNTTSQRPAPWTAHEVKILRDKYGKIPLSTLAKELITRTPDAIKMKAAAIGLTFNRAAEFGPEFDALLFKMHGEGYSDADIAAEWGANIGTIGTRRRAFGLTSNRFNARHKNKIKMSVRKQLKGAGVKNLGELRAMVWRLNSHAAGWGPFSRTEARILDQLETGPKTKRMLCQALGRKYTGCSSLTINHRSYMVKLVKAGMVKRVGKRAGIIADQMPGETVFSLAPGVQRQHSSIRGAA